MKNAQNVKLKKAIIVFVGCLIIAGGYLAFTKVSYDFDTSPFAYASVEEEKKHNHFLSQFRQFEKETTVILEREAGFNSLDVFQRLQTAQDDFYNIAGLEKITSLQTLILPTKTPFGIIWSEALPLEEHKFNQKFSLLKKHQDIMEKFLSVDEKFLCFYVRNDSTNSNFTNDLDSALRTLDFVDEYYLLGENVQSDQAEKALANESLTIGITAIIILLVLFFIFVPSPARLISVLFITLLNVSFTFIFMVLLKIPITVLTGIVPGIVAILSFTDQMHISYHYSLLKRDKAEEKEIFAKLFQTIGLPLILTSLANLIGFIIFFVNGGIERINELALIATLGIITSYILSRLVLPQLLSVRIKRGKGEEKATAILSGILGKVIGKPVFSLLFFSVLTLGIGYIVYEKSTINMHYYSQDENRLKYEEASAVYDQNFLGVRDIEIVIEQESSLFNSTTVSLIEEIENYLLEEYECTSIYSLNTILKRYERYLAGGAPTGYKLPKSIDEPYISEINKFKHDLGIDALLNEGETCTRVIGSLPDIGTHEGLKRSKALEIFLQKLDTDYSITIGGNALMFDKGVYGLSRTVIVLLVIGISLVSIFISLYFRKFWLGLATIWVNLLPIGFALSMMAILGVDINPSSLFMLTILIGIAFDDSIYLLGNLKRIKGPIADQELIQNLSKNAFPLMVTSFVIGFAFIALLLSAHHITYNFGIIMATSLIFALATDLLLLPVLIRKIYRNT